MEAFHRRAFLRACSALAAGTVAGCQAFAGSAARKHQTPLVYVGTQNRQLHALRFDAATGTLEAIGQVAAGPKTTWAVVHPRLPILYAVDDDNTYEGSVIAYAIDGASGALREIGKTATGGNGTTYLSLDAPSMTLLAANFFTGSVSSIALEADGRPGALVTTIKETGSGPHRRQTKAHAHSALVDPSGRFVLVPDMGADRVFVYGFDRATRVLAPDDEARPRAFAIAPGSGPRHLAFGADGRFVYVLDELTAALTVLRWDPQQGRLALVQTLATDSAAFKGSSSAAEIAVGAGGRVVYLSNRGENTLLVYRVAPDSGELTLLQRLSSGGEAPWSFALHPSGRWMLVANQKSGKVNVFAVDPVSGLLADTGRAVAVPTPVSLTFAG